MINDIFEASTELCQRIDETRQKCPPRRKEVKTNFLPVKKNNF